MVGYLISITIGVVHFSMLSVHGPFVDQSVILDSEKLHLGEDLFVEKLFLWQQMSAQY